MWINHMEAYMFILYIDHFNVDTISVYKHCTGNWSLALIEYECNINLLISRALWSIFYLLATVKYNHCV